jgi:hypothetical protein
MEGKGINSTASTLWSKLHSPAIHSPAEAWLWGGLPSPRCVWSPHRTMHADKKMVDKKIRAGHLPTDD